ncbi:leucine-rich repeat-containing protein 36-like [Silurus meridionalis]|uniref:leucine-rich repeat-containing protein 36-like n=1 Tax=Silurus meridionalis TaxID=175797 RepID=UPI001EEA80A6|nr:leucine-rich repeat-containing protein 36-like [Silurus meridionalis]
MNFRYVVLSQTSMNHTLAETETELEARTDRLLRLTNDLYEATHQSDAATQIYEMKQMKISPKYRLQMKTLLNPDKQEMQQTSKQQLKTKEQVFLPEAQGSSLPGTAVQPFGPDVCAVLRTLLDLVDEHWNGQFSLHLNPNFMAKAILLLLPLTKPVPPSQPEKRNIRGNKDELKARHGKTWESKEWWDVEKLRQAQSSLGSKQVGNEEWKCYEEHRSASDEIRRLNRQLEKTQHEQESLKAKLISALKENFILRAEKMKIGKY